MKSLDWLLPNATNVLKRSFERKALESPCYRATITIIFHWFSSPPLSLSLSLCPSVSLSLCLSFRWAIAQENRLPYGRAGFLQIIIAGHIRRKISIPSRKTKGPPILMPALNSSLPSLLYQIHICYLWGKQLRGFFKFFICFPCKEG